MTTPAASVAQRQDGRPEALIRAVEAGEVDFTTMLSRFDIDP